MHGIHRSGEDGLPEGKLMFDGIRVSVGEPEEQSRKVIKEILQDRGVRKFLNPGSLDEVRHSFLTRQFDLLICEVTIDGGGVFDLIRAIRHQEIGDNPFVPIILMTSSPSEELIREVLASGPDDLITKPLSAGKLTERIVRLATNRKPFIVTAEYVGPNRRGDPRQGTQKAELMEVPNVLEWNVKKQGSAEDLSTAIGAPRQGTQNAQLMEVPNVLEWKVKKQGSAKDLSTAIGRCAKVLKEQKVERIANMIAYLTEQVLPLCDVGGLEQQTIAQLNRILDLSRNGLEGLENTQFAMQDVLFITMIDLVDRVVQSSQRPHADDEEKLLKLSRLIGRSIQPSPQAGA